MGVRAGWRAGWRAGGARALKRQLVLHASPARALRCVVAPRCAHGVLLVPSHTPFMRSRLRPRAPPRGTRRGPRAFRNQWLRKRSFCESASGQLEIARGVLLIVCSAISNRSTTVDKPACVPTRTRGNTKGSWNLIRTCVTVVYRARVQASPGARPEDASRCCDMN